MPRLVAASRGHPPALLAPGGWCAGPYLGPAAPVPPLGLQRQLAPRRALWCLPAATEGIHLHSASTPPLTLPLTLPRCLSRQHDHAARRAARQGRHEPLTPERESAACSHVTMSAALYTTSQPTNHVCVCAAHRRMCTCICAHAHECVSFFSLISLLYYLSCRCSAPLTITYRKFARCWHPHPTTTSGSSHLELPFQRTALSLSLYAHSGVWGRPPDGRDDGRRLANRLWALFDLTARWVKVG